MEEVDQGLEDHFSYGRGSRKAAWPHSVAQLVMRGMRGELELGGASALGIDVQAYRGRRARVDGEVSKAIAPLCQGPPDA